VLRQCLWYRRWCSQVFIRPNGVTSFVAFPVFLTQWTQPVTEHKRSGTYPCLQCGADQIRANCFPHSPNCAPYGCSACVPTVHKHVVTLYKSGLPVNRKFCARCRARPDAADGCLLCCARHSVPSYPKIHNHLHIRLHSAPV
jgi:hypothetical protein